MPRFAANVSIMFTEIDFQDRFQADRGLLFQLRGTATNRNVSHLVPPMTSSEQDIDRGIGILNDALPIGRRWG